MFPNSSKIFRKIISGYIECSFTNPAENFSLKTQKLNLFLNSSKIVTRRISGHAECRFEATAEKFAEKLEVFQSSAEKN